MKSKKSTPKIKTIILLKTLGIALLLSIVAMLPFLHDIFTARGEGVYDWVPNLGIEKMLTYTNTQGREVVNGYSSYRTFLYFLFLHVFAAIGWAGWAKDAKPGKPYKFFLLAPAILALYTSLVIIFDVRESSFNEASSKIFLILGVNFLLMVWFLYNYYKRKKRKHNEN